MNGEVEKQDETKAEESPASGAVVDLTPVQIRARIRRRIATFILLVVLGSALAALMVTLRYGGRTREEEPVTLPVTPRRITRQSALPALAPAPAATSETKQVVSPETAARAMEEMRIARKYLLQRDWSHAEKHALQALEIYPEMDAALRMLGVIYTQRGMFDEAIAVLERALRADPFNAETYNTLATAYLQKGNTEKAEDLLLTALEIRPDYAIARVNLGMVYLASGRYGEAVEALEPVLEAAPDQVGARNNFAVALTRIGRYADARRELAKVLRINPETPAAYFNMAIVYLLEGDTDRALEWIRRGVPHCTPVMLRKFLADSDFDPLRDNPEFRRILEELLPRAPRIVGPESG